MERAEAENVEEIKNAVRRKLQETGVNNLIRHMVRDLCSDNQETDDIDPDEVVQELYKRGLLKKVLANLELTENIEKEINTKLPEDKYGSEDEEAGQGNMGTAAVDYDGAGEPMFSKPEAPYSPVKGNPERCSTKELSDLDASLHSSIKEEKVISCDTSRNEPANVVPETPYEKATKGILNGKYFLKFEVLGGKGFLEQLLGIDSSNENRSSFILHISYKSQRFFSEPVKCHPEPKIQTTAMIDLGYFENGSVLQLLTKGEAIGILLIQEDWRGMRNLVSTCNYDWRSLLISEKSKERVYIPLMGIGPESQIPVGTLTVKLTIVPRLAEILSHSTFAAQINAERSIQDEKERLFLIYVKQWWREFMEIRPEHGKRHVKIFSYDENSIPRPVQSFVRPITCDRVLLTPFHAAWFVSLIAMIKTDTKDIYSSHFASSRPETQGSGFPVLCDHWQSLLATLATRTGRVEDHANLLCSLLLGFGLDAYVAIGSVSGGKPWVWVVTLDDQDCATFWESTTGLRYSHKPKSSRGKGHQEYNTSPDHGYKTISCLFNHKLFYANVQSTNFLDVVDWNLENPGKWKKIPECTLKTSTKMKEAPVKLFPPNISCTLLAIDIEVQLKTLISETRMKCNLRTRWNNALASTFGQELAKYEIEASCGALELAGQFHSVVLKNIPAGNEFKGFPWNGNTQNAQLIFSSLMRNPKCEDIILLRGNNVQHSLRVQVFSFPENVSSTRLLLACQFIPEN